MNHWTAQAHRRQEESYRNEDLARKRRQEATSLANDALEDEGPGLTREQFDRYSGHRDEYADHAWEIYLAIADRES